MFLCPVVGGMLAWQLCGVSEAREEDAGHGADDEASGHALQGTRHLHPVHLFSLVCTHFHLLLTNCSRVKLFINGSKK